MHRHLLLLIIERLSNAVLVFDAAGLALFAVAGAFKALSFGLNPVMATFLGMVTGIGGNTRLHYRIAWVAELFTYSSNRY